MGTGRQFCLTNCLRSALSWSDFLLFSTSASGESSSDFSLQMCSARLCLSRAGSCPFIELSVLIHKSRPGRKAPFPILGHIFVLMFLARLVLSSRMRHLCFMLLYVSYPSLSFWKGKPGPKTFCHSWWYFYYLIIYCCLSGNSFLLKTEYFGYVILLMGRLDKYFCIFYTSFFWKMIFSKLTWFFFFFLVQVRTNSEC